MRLLIVDDGAYIIEYIKHLISWDKMGINSIETTTNSVKAIDILDHKEIDIMITDIRMPEVSGIDLLIRIKEKSLKTKTIILSGYSDFDYAQKALRFGALDYLLKPIDKDDLEITMNKVMKTIDQEDLVVSEDIIQNEKEKKVADNDMINTIQTYIDDNLGSDLNLDDLGSHVYLHPVYLSKLYKQETGEKLSNYILRKRMVKASELLIDSNLNVNDISHLVGYKKPQYFIKLFKIQFGHTPQQYRKKNRRKKS